MEDILTAIRTKFTALIGAVHNDFYLGLSGRLYFDEAPQDVTYPYATYYFIAAVPDWVMGDDRDFEDVSIQFNIYSNNPSAKAEILSLGKKCNDLYHKQEITISNYTFIDLYRSFQNCIKDDEGNWQYIIEFRLQVRETT